MAKKKTKKTTVKNTVKKDNTKDVKNNNQEQVVNNDVVDTNDNVVDAQEPTIKTKEKVSTLDSDTKNSEGGDMISVSRTDLEKLIARVEDLEGAANLKRLQSVQEKRDAGNLIKTVRVNTWDDKAIIFWQMTKNYARVDSRGREHEEQEILLHVIDLENIEYDEDNNLVYEEVSTSYRDFFQRKRQSEFEVVGETARNGQFIFTILLDDGAEVDINIKYLN